MSLFGDDDGDKGVFSSEKKSDDGASKTNGKITNASSEKIKKSSVSSSGRVKLIEEEAIDFSCLRKVEKLSCYNKLEEKLLSQFQQEKLHHAIMLSGDFGIGKSTFAYWIISQILMLKVGDNEQMKLATMEMLQQNKYPDVFFLSLKDGKNEIGVEDVREVLSKVILKSIYGIKFVLIDDVNSINVNGVNALLKTLEEPPENTYFFIINHKISPVLDTIYSRCNEIEMKISYKDCLSALTKLHNDWSFDEVEFYTQISGNSISFAEKLYDIEAMKMVKNVDTGNRQNLSVLLNKIYQEIDKNNKDLSYIVKMSMLSKVVVYCLNANIVSNANNDGEKIEIHCQDKDKQMHIVAMNSLFIRQFCDIKSFELPVRFV